jgi:hypothetical protein
MRLGLIEGTGQHIMPLPRRAKRNRVAYPYNQTLHSSPEVITSWQLVRSLNRGGIQLQYGMHTSLCAKRDE